MVSCHCVIVEGSATGVSGSSAKADGTNRPKSIAATSSHERMLFLLFILLSFPFFNA